MLLAAKNQIKGHATLSWKYQQRGERKNRKEVQALLFASGDFMPARAQKEQPLEPTRAAQEVSAVAEKLTHKARRSPVYEK